MERPTRLCIAVALLATTSGLVRAAGTAPVAAPAPVTAPVPAVTDEAALAARAAVVAGDLGARLKAELQAALAAGGPLAAIDTCHGKAMAIAVEQGESSGWDVGRTSLRVRNPDNAPDAWERSVLESFAQRVAAGENPATLTAQKTVKVGDHHYFRYMQAIPTVEACTLCHGKAISPEVSARLNALYPDDRATGFAPGDLRGAFTLTRQVD